MTVDMCTIHNNCWPKDSNTRHYNICRLRIEDEIGAAFSSRYCYRVIRLALIGKICDLVERLNFHGWKVAILGGLGIAAQLTRQIGVFLLY